MVSEGSREEGVESMKLLGGIYARGTGAERNFTKALEWLTLASRQQLCSAYNGLGYIYVKGYGVEKNNAKAKEYFEKAGDNGEAGGLYNLGVMYLKGIGVNSDAKIASKYFINAFDIGQSKVFYQLAKMFHTGVGLKKNVPLVSPMDCGVFVAASEGLPMQSCDFNVESQRARYASLLWHYGATKANQAHTSDNDDPPHPRYSFPQSTDESVIITLY
ncbi:ERAD-associated E3 ubiquitin-protein ligase component HRD3 [Capsicum baccatum]|uniref:ERAD-associated E3 ubiquitin-protein ligase component HRD3 n=1 Tax=Capsicum baccatum TaxID=33114 RepID=A0A2G2WZZ0_CAPBA|nr:ERAD-associated E3 ubiquitin-protein ligase component HRD3 [Capsicum baccatum]